MNKISLARKQAGLTQQQLAALLGWKQSRIGNYESGARTPNINSCRQIVAALNTQGVECSLDSLFPLLECGE
ncbi:helix-turn-helix transcriptional regulator [Xenorhabdus sp. XENO-10]|uniref:Helix-turn-helix transcriptional regulator n=1 Tax=Xenorhabdus yunnanensis TaxID=3025878 RepID=A0ABT5LJX4_9GAMM|nr:helix-turn-helix transcriptional regulator [Xenorhabdus yunnanensis]MDC9591413.1 helix-turn-helix transcriptional regulator [Xenorhabdus yunnanensis]